jgi:hypothetical protein
LKICLKLFVENSSIKDDIPAGKIPYTRTWVRNVEVKGEATCNKIGVIHFESMGGAADYSDLGDRCMGKGLQRAKAAAEKA